MERSTKVAAFGVGLVVAFMFLVPAVQMWVLLPPTPCQGSICLDAIMHVWAYGSMSYYFLGVGMTYHNGIYGLTVGS